MVVKEKKTHPVPIKIINEIARAMDEISYGSIEVVIHNSQVVQIERKEKFRFDDNTNLNPRGGKS